jgi:DNA-binding transcriptional LysR family regulator
MASMAIELRQLEVFRAVMESRSMTGAARALGVSQPAVSSLIARLEQEVGMPLFRRHKRMLEPTREALDMYDDVVETLSSVSRLQNRVSSLQGGQRGHLLVAAQPLVGLSVLPAVIARFQRSRPQVMVRLLTGNSAQVRRLLAGSAFDLGIAEVPIDQPNVMLHRFKLDLVCIMPLEHRLGGEPVITPGHLDGETLIVPAPEREIRHRISRVLSDAGIRWEVAVEADLFSVACALVAHGAGIALVDPWTAADVGRGRVLVKPFAPALVYEIAIYRPPARPLSTLSEQFLDALRDAVDQPPGQPAAHVQAPN